MGWPRNYFSTWAELARLLLLKICYFFLKQIISINNLGATVLTQRLFAHCIQHLEKNNNILNLKFKWLFCYRLDKTIYIVDYFYKYNI